MSKYCAFSENHYCAIWTDYQVLQFAVDELDETCHNNWIEISKQQDYIDLLKRILEENGITVPSQY